MSTGPQRADARADATLAEMTYSRDRFIDAFNECARLAMNEIADTPLATPTMRLDGLTAVVTGAGRGVVNLEADGWFG